MATCTFFGHADTSEEILPLLQREIVKLIENHGVSCFYVGNHGNFDRLVIRTLKALQQEHPSIEYSIVLAYLPTTSDTFESENTLYPAGIESVPKRFAIVWRNRWMLNKSQFVITHVVSPSSRAAKFKALAEKQKKTVINLA